MEKLNQENFKLKNKLQKYRYIYPIVEFFRPPSPKLNIVGKQKRKYFSQLIEDSGIEGAVLDIGSGKENDKSIKGLSTSVMARRKTINIVNGPGVDIIASVESLPLESESVAGVLFQGVIEHIQEPKIAINEINRVLKKGGYIYVEAPFMQHFHYDPIDYYRFTDDGLAHVFSNSFKIIEKGPLFGPSAVLQDVLTEYFAVFFKSPYFYWGVKWILGWLFMFIKYIDYFLVKRPRAKYLSLGVYVLGQKYD